MKIKTKSRVSRRRPVGLSATDADEDGASNGAPRGNGVLPTATPVQGGLPAAAITADQPASDLIRSAIQGAISRIRAADPMARRGEPEGIHRMRTGSRRLRSELHALRDLVEPHWREAAEGELKWLAGLLGDVRDLDILEHRLHDKEKPGGDGSPSPGRAEPFFDRLHERHDRNSRALRDALDGERYRGLIAALESAIATTPLADEAHQPCRVALPPIARDAWRRLRKKARALKEHTPDEAFHDVRKSAKRARYTAELIAPALGPEIQDEAGRFIRLTTQVQTVLGDHQDAVVAAAELERFLDDSPEGDPAADDARKLLKAQRKACDKSRDKFFKVWEKLDRKKSTRWIKDAEKGGS
ncbi:CHAD domain protein [Aquisphaera giovannonii]|uniref:CHAD domain protein n=1 Tax=Aquisphaera giovannonii TaxID=406548 RepID=A0A5B9W1K7_9BACT|nr:CHAD domain-containing protein [Aquisphaera giovannonii]QEH34476.1 CHAD domain protein [Aquisphaera giovannonii]